MAGGSHPKSSHDKPSSSSSSHRKSRWELSDNHPSASKSKDPKPPPNPNPNSKSNSNPSPRPNNTGPSKPSPKPNSTTPRKDPGNSLQGPSFPFPDFSPPPPPTYGFHMLERRSIVLADGSARSYFALPPDYQDFPPRPPVPPRFLPMGPNHDFPGGPGGHRFPPMSPEGLGLGFRDNNNNQNQSSSMKRKFGGGEEELRNGIFPGPGHRGEFFPGTSSPFRRGFGDESRAGKYMRMGSDGGELINKHHDVDQNMVKKAFLHFSKLINETEAERKRYLEDGKQGRLQCVACGRTSKEFQDMHALLMHTYNSDNADLRVDHLGLHRALCVLMGWNYSKPPDNAKAYQFLPANEAAANQEDLVLWPPMVLIHNTLTGKSKEGRMEGLGNKVMDSRIRDLGFSGGKSKSLYGRDGHLGITLVKFGADQMGLKEAQRLSEHLEKENHGRKAWGRIQPLILGKDDDKNPNLVKMERGGEETRILYGYLGTAADLYKVDFETKKKVTIESQRELRASK